MDDADRRRWVLRDFMKRHGLKRTTWAKAAGISEGNFRDFMNGRTEGMGIAAYEALARAAEVTVSELVGETPSLSREEMALIEKFRAAPNGGRRAAHAVLDAVAEPERSPNGDHGNGAQKTG